MASSPRPRPGRPAVVERWPPVFLRSPGSSCTFSVFGDQPGCPRSLLLETLRIPFLHYLTLMPSNGMWGTVEVLGQLILDPLACSYLSVAIVFEQAHRAYQEMCSETFPAPVCPQWPVDSHKSLSFPASHTDNPGHIVASSGFLPFIPLLSPDHAGKGPTSHTYCGVVSRSIT